MSATENDTERWERQIGELTLANYGDPKSRKIRLAVLKVDDDVAQHLHEKRVCEYWGISPLLYKKLDRRQVAIAVAALKGESAGKTRAAEEMAP